MEYPVIDLVLDEGRMTFREATEAERKEAKGTHRQDVIYWVKHNGRLLRAINRDGLDKLLLEIRWIDDQEILKIANNIMIVFAALHSRMMARMFRAEAGISFVAKWSLGGRDFEIEHTNADLLAVRMKAAWPDLNSQSRQHTAGNAIREPK
ncbi:hypothetical protein IB276_17780 [Ensifer sp. ENS04]|uniref:hypothetical protein n=1 Tax=Ensifer sp. ENS04 TaxID=2769281 RepID=UPI00177AB655|nr:hypothetical protein [Ensifer sp. ENS04]MBD9541308.1 hypothetical protein [Ensifer sp. ENS04]